MNREQLLADLKQEFPNVAQIELSPDGVKPVEATIGHEKIIFHEKQDDPHNWFGIRTSHGYQAVHIARRTPLRSTSDVQELMARVSEQMQVQADKHRIRGDAARADQFARFGEELKDLSQHVV